MGNYVELSDRKIIEWGQKSGFNTQKSDKSSNDKPEFCFGVPTLDDFSVRMVIANMAYVVPRNYVVMEVKSNLIEAERVETLKRFPANKFKRTACVAVGEPKKEFKDKMLAVVLKEKQDKAVAEWKA